jgi:hypothetical protein
MSITPITGDMPTVITPTVDDYADIELPIDMTCPDGRAAIITAVRETCQLPESIAGDESTGWITVPVGYLLTECVYDITNGQQDCGVRLALDVAGNIAAQVEAAIAACA